MWPTGRSKAGECVTLGPRGGKEVRVRDYTTLGAHTSLILRLRACSRAASGVAVLLGASVELLGWGLGLVRLKSVSPNLPQMVSNTALLFIAAGAALALLGEEGGGSWRRRTGQACALVVTLIGALTLSECLMGWDLGIDHLVANLLLGAQKAGIPNRPSPNTALDFTLLGLAILAIDVESRRGQRPAEFLALAAGAIALLAFVGYTHSVTLLYGPSPSFGMAVHTALGCLVLSVGVLCARPDRGLMAHLTLDSAGSAMARRLVGAVIGVPLVLGWLSLAGEKAGLYGHEASKAFLAVTSIVVLALLVWVNARSLNFTDAERRRAEEALREAHEGLERRVRDRTAELEQANKELQSEIAERRRVEASRHALYQELLDHKNQLRALMTQILQVREEESRRIAHLLHDETGQTLTFAHIALDKVARELPPTASAHLQEVAELLHQIETQLRRLSHELRPTVLDDLGLLPAIRYLAQGVSARTGLQITVEGSIQGRLPFAIETAWYRIIQEALTNVSKHAKASRVGIQIDQKKEAILCTIRDDGSGFDAPSVLAGRGDGGLGLIGIRERIEALHGTLQIISAPDRGTELSVTVPVECADVVAHPVS